MENNEKLMLVKCIESDGCYDEGEYYWAVTELNYSLSVTFYKVIHNSRNVFLNCPSRDSMLDIFSIVAEKDVSFDEKQKWVYNGIDGSMKKEHPEYFPASIDKAKELNLKF